MNTSQVTRVEVIDHTLSIEDGGGRCYVKWEENIQVEVQLQDDGKTLKIFIAKPENQL